MLQARKQLIFFLKACFRNIFCSRMITVTKRRVQMYRSHEWAANYPCEAFAGLSWRLIDWKQSAVLRVNCYKDYFNYTNCGLLKAMTFTRQVIVSDLNSWMPPEPSSHCSFHVICNDVLFYGIYLQIMQSLFWNLNNLNCELFLFTFLMINEICIHTVIASSYHRLSPIIKP